MRASRLLQLQVRGRMTAPTLADALEVSVRTVYRDVDALAAAGVPVFTEPGRNGGISLLPGYRLGGLPDLGEDEARALLLAGTPELAAALGLGSADATETLLRSMPIEAESVARALRDRLHIEPAGWWEAVDEVPHLPVVAQSVWDERLLRMRYRGLARVVSPLGLVVKGTIWYLLAADERSGHERVFRVSRIEAAEVLAHAASRPEAFDLASAWEERMRAFTESIPTLMVKARVSPSGEGLLHLLEEGTPTLPLPRDIRRDDEGWVVLDLRFERVESAGRLLLRLGGDVEVLGPVAVRRWMAEEVGRLAQTYRSPSPERPGRLIVVCGLPGAGKTTLARELERSHDGVRLCPDEWMADLGFDLFDGDARSRIEQLQWTVAQRLLGLGHAVIIEWGTWTRDERDALRAGARALGAAVELRFLDAPVDVLWDRVRERDTEEAMGSRPLTRDDIVAYDAMFERPDADELAQYDDPAR